MSECPEEEVNDIAWITRKVVQEMLYLSQVFCWIKARALERGSGGQQIFWQEEAEYAKIQTSTFYSGNHSELRVWQGPLS